jgi:hypothetical protein
MITIPKPGKTKQELLSSLDKLKTDFAQEISEYDLNVDSIPDGYKLEGNKKILMLEISVEMEITAQDGKYEINYKTKNVPQAQIDKAIGKATEILKKY